MRRWLPRDLVNGPYLSLCLTEKDFKARLRAGGITDTGSFMGSAHADATTHNIRFNNGTTASVVCLTPEAVSNNNMTEIAGLLVHEAVHVWQNFRRHIGEHEPGDEFEAYSIQAISQRLIGSFQEQTQAPPKKARRKRGRKV